MIKSHLIWWLAAILVNALAVAVLVAMLVIGTVNLAGVKRPITAENVHLLPCLRPSVEVC